MNDSDKQEIIRRSQVAHHALSIVEPKIKTDEERAFNRLMAEFEGGQLTLEKAVSILGEIKGYRNILNDLKRDIKRAAKLNQEVRDV